MPAAAPPSFQTSPFYPSLHSPPSFSFLTSPRRSHFRTITSSRKLSISPGHLSSSSRSSFYHSFKVPEGLEEEEHVIGDSVVFEEGVFEDPYLQDDFSSKGKEGKHKGWKNESEIQNNLVPENWRQIQEEINITKKERQRIAHELKFGPRWEKKRILATRDVNLPERLAYREEKLAKWKPLVLDNPTFQAKEEKAEATDGEKYVPEREERVAPKNPRWDVYGRTLDNISELFNSVNYKPGHNASKEGQRRLFTMEEKALLNRRIPDLAAATSEKWLPLQALAASGEFYLMHALLKHNVDINGADKDGLTALHKAIIGKRQAITCYLLRESANPFVRDKDGASLMHYAVQAASVPAIKILLLYNVDINLQDKDGWTPLHVAVQTRRTDLVRLLLIKGADQSIKNQDGLTPLDLCLHSGRDTRTYELIKLLKQLPEFRLTANTGRALPL